MVSCLGFITIASVQDSTDTNMMALRAEKRMGEKHDYSPCNVSFLFYSEFEIDSNESSFLFFLGGNKTPHPSGRMSIDKTISGELVATTRGQMLSAMTEVKGSAGYVAIERVEGTLKGKKGTFVLQHTGTMNQGSPSLSVTVVPDSGTGELVGIAGQFNIVIAAGKHSYEFKYTLP